MRFVTVLTCMAFGLYSILPVRADEDASMPQPVTADGITYLSGGIGKEEADYINARVRRYDLALYFVEQKTGKYLADVDLEIQDRSGNVVISKMIEGPIFLAKLPRGRYKIVATESGREKQRYTRINGKGVVRLVFHWPSQPET